MSISMSAPMPDDRSFHVLEAVASRLDASPRRRWSAEAYATGEERRRAYPAAMRTLALRCWRQVFDGEMR